MRSFIIRPFGKKTALSGQEIDFDAVAARLIDPALTAAGLTGRDTIEIMEQGNIREDMFQRLLTADVVIADITIHNANVFYELGLRHALRGRVTFLLRGNTTGDAVPFDLKTDRYLGYDTAKPEESLSRLTDGILASMRSERPDSPVFQLLPNMKPQNPDAFLVVPVDFQEGVRLCAEEGRIAELALMSLEIERLSPEWEVLGHRLVGDALFAAKAFERARSAWERVRKNKPDDVQANLRLGTIYQKLGQLGKSEVALERIRTTDRSTLAELESLRGSNTKQLWLEEWQHLSGDEARAAALESPFLDAARQHYASAYAADMNHTYSGINALAMTRILCELAKALPATWAELHASDDDAARDLKTLQKTADRMVAALTMALDASDDPWAATTRADLVLLTNPRPRYAARQYRAALHDKAGQTTSAVLRQLGIYTQLGLMEPSASAVMTAIRTAISEEESHAKKRPRFVIFTGHRIDKPDRKNPRFPNTEHAIKTAQAAIGAALKQEQDRYPGEALIGVCGGANGADLLFQEACDTLGIQCWLLLAVPREAYIKASVADAGRDWVDRFEAIFDSRKAAGRLLVLQDQEDQTLPNWLLGMEGYGLWQRNNLWSLSFGFQNGPERASLIALWDGKVGDGIGGTEDMVELSKDRGVPYTCLLYTSPSPRDRTRSRMPSSA